MSFAPKMLSGLASFKSDANTEGEDRNSQLETVLVFLSCVNVLKNSCLIYLSVESAELCMYMVRVHV